MKTEKIISNWVKALSRVKDDQKMSAIKNLSKILAKKKRSYLFPDIVKKFKKLFFQEKMVELILARKQSQESQRALKKKMSVIFGKNQEIETVIDQELIGGFRVRTKNRLIKASVKDYLDSLKDKIY